MKSEITENRLKIVAVCTSPLTGTKKNNVIQGVLMENQGLLEMAMPKTRHTDS